MRTMFVAAILITGTFASHAEAATGPIPLNCNRACLENLVDQYLAAVVAHDPKRLPGTVNKGILSDGRPYEFKGFNRPSSILASEAFLIENGKIRRVEMIGSSAPYHINSPWPGGLTGN